MLNFKITTQRRNVKNVKNSKNVKADLDKEIESQKITDANKILMESAVDNFQSVYEMLEYLSDNNLHLIDTYYDHNYFCELLNKKDEALEKQEQKQNQKQEHTVN